MTMTNIYKNTYTAHFRSVRWIMHGALAVLLLTGCVSDREPVGEDEFKEEVPTTVSFSIISSFNNSGMSRATPDGTPANAENDNEKINDWFLVFTDRNNVVRKIISRSESGKSTVNNPVEEETFRFIVPSGTYSVYAFANITETELKDATGLTFSEGDVIDPSTVDGKTWTAELNGWDIDSKPIPMSGFLKNIQVKNTIEETFSIEVVRMVAKVQLVFSNPTDKDITINNVSLDPVTSTAVSLFPRGADGIDYSYLGRNAYSPLADATYSPVIVEKDILVESGKTDLSSSIYIKESLSTKQNDGAFTLGLMVSHTDGIQEHQQYNITKDIRGYINRNDWIVIPITLSRYDVSVETLFYPPIGGYPAVLSTVAPDGSQVFTFETEGEFSIVPHVVDKLSGTHLAPGKYSIELGAVSDETGIFATTPTVTHTASSLPDEITGTLSSKTGKATVEVKVKIDSQIYTRKVYIIRN